jgi:hypothetical protein
MLRSTAELDDFAAVAFRWSAGWSGSEGPRGFSFFRQFEPEFAALIGFAVKRLGDRCWTANLAEQQDFDLKVAAFSSDLQQVANPDVACRLDWMIVRSHSAELAGTPSQRARFEESGSPEPFIDADGFHGSLTILQVWTVSVNRLILSANRSSKGQTN